MYRVLKVTIFVLFLSVIVSTTSYLTLRYFVLGDDFSDENNALFQESFFDRVLSTSQRVKRLFTSPPLTLDEELNYNFGKWKPLTNDLETIVPAGKAKIGNKIYETIFAALEAIEDGQTLNIGPGTYQQSFRIRKNSITIQGSGHVIFEKSAYNGKAAFVTNGNNITLKNIECRYINVPDKNGACVRSEGGILYLEHVYFHSSQSGVLANSRTELLSITDSRFEKLGYNGRAHGIYFSSAGDLLIHRSIIAGGKSKGHDIKSRAKHTRISNSIIASLSGEDSRLIDITNPANLTIINSILHHGKNSDNIDAIGYGLESSVNFRPLDNYSISLINNMILLERDGLNKLFRFKKGDNPKISATKNLIISKSHIDLPGNNLIFKQRNDLNLKPYPALPGLPD